MSRAPQTEVAVDEASRTYIGRWNRLVSTTNWEKGRIIQEWRAALQSAGAPATESSDEAWSRLVGGVTGQHVGRLRRVYERFGAVHEEYEGLYWSHFQAALDWDDAEMWLEGSLQNTWSVSQMRRQRWEALGAVQGQEPRDQDLLSVDLDEDFPQDAAEPAKVARDGAAHVLSDDGAYLAEAQPRGSRFRRRAGRAWSCTRERRRQLERYPLAKLVRAHVASVRKPATIAGRSRGMLRIVSVGDPAS